MYKIHTTEEYLVISQKTTEAVGEILLQIGRNYVQKDITNYKVYKKINSDGNFYLVNKKTEARYF